MATMRKTAKGFYLLAMACALVWAFASGNDGVRADPIGDLFIAPDSLYVVDESFFVLAVRVSDEVTSLMGYNVAITFDNTVIQILGANEGPLPLNSGHPTFFYWYNTGAMADSIHVNGAILGETVDGPGTLFVLAFEALDQVEDQETDVRIVFSELRDGVNQSIAHTVTDGWVKVLVTVPVEHRTWGAIKDIYR